MKFYFLKTVLVFTLLTSCSSQNDDTSSYQTINLPLTFIEGFGPFAGYGSALNPEHTLDNPNGAPWVGIYRPVKGIPAAWREVVKTMVWLNGYQVVYQNYKAGNISQEMYESLQKSWKWSPDEKQLSEKPIKCFVYVVRGIDKTGKVAVLIDQNNNLDMSDETAFYPETVTIANWNANYQDSHKISYEVFREGSVLGSQIPMLIKHVSDTPGNQYWYCFPQYARAELKVDGKKYQLAIQGGFSNPDYNIAEIVLSDALVAGKKYSLGEGVVKGELLAVGGIEDEIKYKNLGVNTYHNVLQMQGMPVDKDAYSLQAGYLFEPFEAKEFSAGKKITLHQYKGKYLFVDFWGTWCPGCVQALPGLREIYAVADKKKVAFLSIAGHDSPEKLKKFLSKKPLPWLQILSDSSNELIEKYHIEGFPTTVLIGPDGRVVAKNLQGKSLKVKLEELNVIDKSGI